MYLHECFDWRGHLVIVDNSTAHDALPCSHTDMKRDLPVDVPADHMPSRYLRVGLPAVWTAFWLLMATIDFQEYVRGGGTRFWEPLTATGTSALAATLVAAWQLRRAGRQKHLLKTPLRWFLRMWTWVPLLALAYVAGVYAMRASVYALAGREFRHPPWTTVFAYEISKFVLFYLLLSGVHFGVRSFSAWKGQRSPDEDGADRTSGTAMTRGRLLITERGRTTIVRYEEIEWLDAADNYVNLHLDGQEMLVRRTLSGLLKELDDGFVRTHRSAAVRLDLIAAVRPRDKGNATVVMKSGAEVPCSRQHRAALIGRIQPSRANSPLEGPDPSSARH